MGKFQKRGRVSDSVTNLGEEEERAHRVRASMAHFRGGAPALRFFGVVGKIITVCQIL